ncbi:GHKL domain-containing protein [Bacillus sp. HMF5848]|uniref:ATP-binding protein n=1 Tax=Bacillus sp. HMF5848 TaxID=2495421 RepID=UPI000F79E1FA|nr:ATP-binding protein [Bacillus sp. HMF5848]RSK26044.1 GHKL domain-containing protein [Bacillus sp. HMF5848]
MNNPPKNTALINEEIKALKLFIILFYIIYFGYDIIYYFIDQNLLVPELPYTGKGLGIWLYIILLAILPISVYLINKKNKVYSVKYLYITTFLVIDLIHHALKYYDNSDMFRSGNAIEPFIVLFAPLFINKKYFWFVNIGIVIKYALLGLILKEPVVGLPIILLTILAAIAYILLNRFSSYLHTLTATHEELRQSEKLAVIGKMATAIGHEIRNPLSALKGFTQLLNENKTGNDTYYPIMIQEIDRINDIVSELMLLGRPKAINSEKNNIGEIIYYVTSILEQQAKACNISLSTKLHADVPTVLCDENQMKQVFINLIKNAIEAMPHGGEVVIEVKPYDQTSIAISIKDEGYGMAHDVIEKLGEPFYTTKENGNGLGLMVTKKIIEDHDGKMKITSELNKGTTFSIILPI